MVEHDLAKVGVASSSLVSRSKFKKLQNRADNPRVFGAVLHGRDTERSDLDILVDPLPGTTLYVIWAGRLFSKSCSVSGLIY